MKILAPVLVLSLCCAVPSYGKVVEIDPGQTVTVNDGECEEGYSFKDATGTLLLNLSAAPSCTITGAGTVKKTSSSDWTLTTALPDFTGEYHLLGSGIVSIGVNKALGSTSAGAKGVFVHDGATLKITNASVGFSDRPLNLTGSGVDGCGALWVAAGVSGGTAFSKYINLPEGDARIAVDGNPSGFGSTQIYTYSGSISLNGHTLTKAGTGGWYLYMAKVKDSGTILVEGAADKSKRGYLCVRQWSPVGTAGKLTVRTKNLATLDFWDAEPSEQKYALEVDGELKLTRACGNALVWSGSVSFLSEGSKLVVAPAAPSGNKTAAVKITGLVSGPGSIEYASAGTFTLSNPENSYTGTTVFDGASGGKFLPTCAGAIPEYEKLTYSNGKLDLQVDAEGIRWPAADAMALMTKPDYSNHGARSLNTDALTGPYVVNASAVAASFSQSPVELAVSGTNWHQSIVWEGTKALDYLYDGQGGSWLLDGGADVTVAFDRLSPFRIGTVAGRTARVVVSNACFHSAGEHVSSAAAVLTNSVALGCVSGSAGILEIGAGAVVSNKVSLGAVSGGFGALYQRGGTSVLYGDLSDNNFQKTAPLGSAKGGGGYLELSGGQMSFAGQMAIALQGNGVFVQKGGAFAHTNHVTDAAAAVATYVGIPQDTGNAEYYVAGGTNSVQRFLFNRVGGWGLLTVKGGEVRTKDSCGVACSTWGGTSYANLNGGVLATPGFGFFRGSYSELGHFFVSFGGGVLRCTKANVDVFATGTAHPLDRVTVYAGGATVDTAGLSGISAATPLQRPSGKGVGSIPWTPKSGYAGCPIVKISGNGQGATAHAVFDSESGTITAIEVTSPGCDYTTATATITYANTVLETIALDEYLVDNVTTGAFTKAGAGTLTLKAANTYGGDTVLRGGILKCGIDGAISGMSTFVLAGGNWDMNGKTLSDGAAAPTKFAIDLAEVIDGGTPTCETAIAFAEGSTLEIRHAERAKEGESYVLLNLQQGMTGRVPRLTGALAETGKWKLCRRNGALVLQESEGMVLILR